jgi:DNA-binding winged helix-turn-helix (wHTH) protein
MASNIIDGLVCLIEAKGEFASSARLKDVLWPDAISSDAAVQSYMSVLQGALEGRSKPETYMERNPERGYRLLVNARAAVAEDLPNHHPPTRQVPDDPFQVEVEAAGYILGYHGELMTNVEHRASANWSRTGDDI